LKDLNKGSLFLHAWNFDLSRGILEVFDPEKNCFRNLSEREKNIK